MENKILVIVKKWMLPIITIILAVVLFGIIFVTLDLVTPNNSFYIELLMISCLLIMLKAIYYNGGEVSFEESVSFNKAKNAYYDKVDEHIVDIKDFDKFLDEYNAEVKKQFIIEGIGLKTEDNYGKKKLENLKYKLSLKADKIKPMKSLQVKTRDSKFSHITLKNYRKTNKYIYQSLTSVLSILTSILLASILWKDITMNAENIFRYVTYLLSGVSASYSSYTSGFRITQNSELSYIARLEFVIDKYINWKSTKTHVTKAVSYGE